MAGCNKYLDTHGGMTPFFNVLRHQQGIKDTTLYADITGFISPSVITGDNLRSDLLLSFKNNGLYILELTVGFQTNLSSNAARKTDKC